MFRMHSYVWSCSLQEEIAEFLGSIIAQLSSGGGSANSGDGDRRKQARRRKSSKEYTSRVSALFGCNSLFCTRQWKCSAGQIHCNGRYFTIQVRHFISKALLLIKSNLLCGGCILYTGVLALTDMYEWMTAYQPMI